MSSVVDVTIGGLEERDLAEGGELLTTLANVFFLPLCFTAGGLSCVSTDDVVLAGLEDLGGVGGNAGRADVDGVCKPSAALYGF